MKAAIITVAVLAVLLMFSCARAAVYTSTYVLPDGRVLICTTVTDANDNPVIVNCI